MGVHCLTQHETMGRYTLRRKIDAESTLISPSSYMRSFILVRVSSPHTCTSATKAQEHYRQIRTHPHFTTRAKHPVFPLRASTHTSTTLPTPPHTFSSLPSIQPITHHTQLLCLHLHIRSHQNTQNHLNPKRGSDKSTPRPRSVH